MVQEKPDGEHQSVRHASKDSVTRPVRLSCKQRQLGECPRFIRILHTCLAATCLNSCITESWEITNQGCFMLLNCDLSYWTENSHTHELKSSCAIILLLKLFQLWPLEAPSNLYFLEVTRNSRLIFYFPHPSSIISHLSSELWFFLVENGVKRLKSGHWAYSLFLRSYCF